MAARQLRWILLGELLFYTALGSWLTSHAGWTPQQAAGLALAGFLWLRLFIVGTTFSLMLASSGSVPADLRIGPLRTARMVLEEYFALLVLFAVVQPFERFWLGPDRLAKSRDGRLPLLLIHGYQCNRGFWFWLRAKLEAAGWIVATHSMEPVWADIDSYAEGIARRVAEVLAATGAPQLILVGHSMGGLASRAYLRRYGSDKVARMISLGSPHQGSGLARLGVGPNARQMCIGSEWLQALAAPGAVAPPAGSVAIFSYHDNYVFPHEACSTLTGAATVAMSGVGHLGMAFSRQVLHKLLGALDAA